MLCPQAYLPPPYKPIGQLPHYCWYGSHLSVNPPFCLTLTHKQDPEILKSRHLWQWLIGSSERERESALYHYSCRKARCPRLIPGNAKCLVIVLHSPSSVRLCAARRHVLDLPNLWIYFIFNACMGLYRQVELVIYHVIGGWNPAPSDIRWNNLFMNDKDKLKLMNYLLWWHQFISVITAFRTFSFKVTSAHPTYIKV